ncbi:MAG TPA: LytTR family DNA-binding domain-containing protein [Saprospiraceae bacterium]|nr:LytTR family DNA-binding domain-containing protein [Saprospiraceae bacterium]
MENINPIPTFKLMVSTTEGTFFFPPQDIVRLEASSNYTYIYFTNRARMFTAKVLKEFASHLEPMGFIRTHRTHLINRNYVSHVSPDGKVMMSDESSAAISRRMKTAVMRELKSASAFEHARA